MPAFLNPAEAEMWVGVGLLIFLGIVIFVAKAPKLINASLDARTLRRRNRSLTASRDSREPTFVSRAPIHHTNGRNDQ